VGSTVLARMAERAVQARQDEADRAYRGALRFVVDGRIEFRTTVGPSGGFTGVGGGPITTPENLIALWQLRYDGLIAVRGQKGRAHRPRPQVRERWGCAVSDPNEPPQDEAMRNLLSGVSGDEAAEVLRDAAPEMTEAERQAYLKRWGKGGGSRG
jgi:hypothetical protein